MQNDESSYNKGKIVLLPEWLGLIAVVHGAELTANQGPREVALNVSVTTSYRFVNSKGGRGGGLPDQPKVNGSVNKFTLRYFCSPHDGSTVPHLVVCSHAKQM